MPSKLREMVSNEMIWNGLDEHSWTIKAERALDDVAQGRLVTDLTEQLRKPPVCHYDVCPRATNLL